MADFQTPFASTAARRSPDADEKANGFPCGAADQKLFNGMFHRIEAELGNLIAYAGLTGTDSDFTQVRQAVQALIQAATGGGDVANYLLLSQAAARLPIFPEVVTSDGRINYTSPAAGTVRMPGGIGILHRGINLVTTAQTDFTTLANRTYHLRWSPPGGFELKLLTDPVYNPDGHPETNPIFDSTFDDILLARIITNATNTPTITALSNKSTLLGNFRQEYVFPNIAASAVSAHTLAPVQPVNWARTPQIAISKSGTSSAGGGVQPFAGALDLGWTAPSGEGGGGGVEHLVTRYGIQAALQVYNMSSVTNTITAHYELTGRA